MSEKRVLKKLHQKKKLSSAGNYKGPQVEQAKNDQQYSWISSRSLSQNPTCHEHSSRPLSTLNLNLRNLNLMIVSRESISIVLWWSTLSDENHPSRLIVTLVRHFLVHESAVTLWCVPLRHPPHFYFTMSKSFLQAVQTLSLSPHQFLPCD